MAPSKCEIFTACIFLIIGSFVTAQTSTQTIDSSSTTTVESEVSQSTTVSYADDIGGCPHCNVIDEVSYA